jgi:hypothetical protein
MKIDFAIVSTDDNTLYSEFWPVVENLWVNLIGIKPILVKISDVNEIIHNNNSIIHNIKKIDGVDTGLQSQIARMFVTKYYKDSVCLTSDIDMLPLSKKYFTSDIENLNNDSMVIFSSDAYKNVNRYPICYNAGKGSLFSEILQLDVSFEEYCNRLLSLGWGWDTDELYFGRMINSYYDQSKITKLNRGWTFGVAKDRLDRIRWKYDPNNFKDQFIDSHSLRPYSTHKTQIDKIVNLVL